MYKYMFILPFLCTCIMLKAQNINTSLSWKKKVKEAEKLIEKGNYTKAAMYYRSAWSDKKEKTELAYLAGQNFFKARDYKMAAKAYEPVKDMNNKYPNVGYKYAMSMKNFGRYKSAKTAFEKFKANASPNETMQYTINQHIKGCELGQQLKENSKPVGIQVKSAGNALNSSQTEFAPVPYGEKGLYFASTKAGVAKIFSSTERLNGQWNNPLPISFIKGLEKPHYGNGSLTPDQEQFYFTQCEMNEKGNSVCEIYVLRKQGGFWKEVQKLPVTINETESNNTHPSVVIDGDTEYLYFASDRVDGVGGMDLWYSSKKVDQDVSEFSTPVNLGLQINTISDEITPYYDVEEGKLYFSSDGQVGIGGFDVFYASGKAENWSTAENMKLPVNSSFDDMYYVKRFGSSSAYLISNRTELGVKESSLDDDIFVVSERLAEIYVKGAISSKGEPIQKVSLSLYKANEAGNMRKILGEIAPGGTYSLQLQPDKSYRLRAAKEGYQESEFEFETGNPSTLEEIIHNFELIAVQPLVANTPEPETKTIEEVINQPSSVQPISEPATSPVVETLKEEVPQTPQTAETLSVETTTRPELGKGNARPAPAVTETTIVETVPGTEVTETVVTTPQPIPTVGTIVETPPEFVEEPKTLTTYPTTTYTTTSYPTTTYSQPTVTYPESTTYDSSTSYTTDSYTTYTDNPTTSSSYTSTPSIGYGVEYRVQLAALQDYKDERFSEARNLGNLLLEGVNAPAGYLTRVMIDGFTTKSDAVAVMEQAKAMGFGRAFVIKYKDGIRTNQMTRSK